MALRKKETLLLKFSFLSKKCDQIVVLIKENAVIELFSGKQPPPPTVCHAMESSHGFTVTLFSATPIPFTSQWTYSFRPSER